MKQLRMTMEQYGIAVRAAFAEGFAQGSRLSKGVVARSVADDEAEKFWRNVEDVANAAVSPEAPHA